MGNWTITVAQLPIPGTGQFHNMILIRDDAGNIYKEIDGGPADEKGHLIAIGSNNMFQAGTAHTSGVYPVGAEIYDQAHYYRQGLSESQPLFSGTQSQIMTRLAAAREAMDSFDPRYRYVLTGGPVTDSQTHEQTPGFNSNSVAATLLWAMGIDPNSSLIPNKATPGSDRLLLELPQIRDLIQQHNLDTPEGDRIPLPSLPPEKRGDNLDGSYEFASLQPGWPMPAVQSASAAQADPQNIRIPSRVVVPGGNDSPGFGGSPDARIDSRNYSAPSNARPGAPALPFNDRFGNWNSPPADDFDNPSSPLLRELIKRRSSAAPDAPAQSNTAFEMPGSTFGRLFVDAAHRAANGLLPSAEAAPLPVAPPDSSGAPALSYVPSGVSIAPDRQDTFNDRFGNWTTPEASPAQSDAQKTRVLRGFVVGPDGSRMLLPGPEQAPQPEDRPKAGYGLPLSISGLPDQSASGGDMDDWLARWMPLFRQ